MIAVETNVLVDLFLPTPHSAVARRLAETDSQWHAPLLWRSEFASVLWQHHRVHGLPLEAAVALHARACEWMDGGEHIPRPDAVMALAFGSNASVYDCEFVAVARELEVPLVSHDRRLAGAFPESVCAPRAILDRS